MTEPRTQRGQPTKRALTPLCLLFVCTTAMAQQAIVEHCKNTSSDADRIACLEAALLGKSGEPTGAAQIDPPGMDLEAGPADAPLPKPAATAAPAATQPLAKPAAEPQGIGAEQVIARDQTRDERDEAGQAERGLVVAKYEWVPYERLVVTFENGQVWRQIKGDVNRIRTSLKRNQTADISESALGGYQLHLNEIRRTIRVERIR